MKKKEKTPKLATAGRVLKTGGRVAGLLGLAGLGFGSNKKKYAKAIIAGTAAQVGGYFLEKHAMKKAASTIKKTANKKHTTKSIRKK